MKIRKAIIPAAGWGLRFLPMTKAQPKEMLPIVDKPALQYIVEEAVAAGIEDILIITGSHKSKIVDHFAPAVELELALEAKGQNHLLAEVQRITERVNLHYLQQEEPRGLGHAIYCAKDFIGNEPFAVLLGDDLVYAAKPCLQQLLEFYQEYPATILGVQEVPREDVGKYGIVKGKQLGKRVYQVQDLVEKPAQASAPSRLAILGRYLLKPTIFAVLERTRPGVGGEIQLTDALKELAQREAMYAYVFAGQRYDIGAKQGFLTATVDFALRRPDLRQEFLQYLRKIVKKEEK